MILLSWPGDVMRWLLFPEPDFGPGRLTGMGTYQLTGRLCGTDTACVATAGAVLTGIATVLLLVHTRQLMRSALIAVAVGSLWLLSPPLLGISLWQSARFDLLGFIGVVAAGSLWWWAFGRAQLGLGMGVVVALLSIPVMAFAFGSKEAYLYLAGVLPAMAIGRGLGRSGRVWRNLAVAALPMAYGIYYVWHALTNASSAYLDVVGGADPLRIVPRLLRETVGVDRAFMFLNQEGERRELSLALAQIGFGLFVLALIAVAVWSIRRGLLRRPLARLRTGAWTLLARRLVPWVYLAGTIIVLVGAAARSEGAVAYYMPVGYWAALTLGALTIRWLARPLPRPQMSAAVLGLLYAIPALVAYVSLVTLGSTYGQLEVASARMADAGAIIRGALAERRVEQVDWRMLQLPATGFYVTRGDPATNLPDDDIWPWLMQDRNARPDVVALETGTLDELRRRVAELGGPGRALVVMDGGYRLLLLAHEGRIYWDPFGPG
jgi:hypothetical protein